MKKFLLFICASLIGWQILNAQSLVKTGVINIKLRNSGPIIQENQVKGYYYFYNLEKEDRKNNNYMISLVDENLREINSANLVRPKNYVLIDGAFNGEAFAFLFFDIKHKLVEIISYDKELKQKGIVTKSVSNDRYSMAYFNQIAQGNEPSQESLVAVGNAGFLFYGNVNRGDFKYEIDLYNNDLKKIWSTTASDDKYNMEMATPAFQNDRYIASTIMKKKGLFSKDVDSYLEVVDAVNGKLIFNTPLETAKYNIMLSELFFDKEENTFQVFGEYYDLKDKEMKSQSLGFMTLTFDINGKIISEKINSWENEISKVLPVNSKGKIEGSRTNILFHNFIRTADGDIFAIGEQYKRAASAGGIAAMALSGGRSGVSVIQLNVYNMVIFQFSQDFTIKKVHFFEKDKNVFSLPAGAEYMTAKTLSFYAKSYGGFDYTFTRPARNKETFMVGYINYDKEKGEKAKNVFGSIVYTPEKNFVVDKLPLTRKSSNYYVYIAKEGYIVVTEYFKKEKRLESRLEKINY